jgi:hypothetical protein
MSELVTEIAASTTPLPLNPHEVSEVGAFLREGFTGGAPALGFSNEVMTWKYFAPIKGQRPQPRSFVRRDRAQLVGHIGLNHRQFVIPGTQAAPVATVHPMDWLASKKHPGAGIALMLKCFDFAPTQYAMGGTEMAVRMQSALGFAPVADMRVLCKVLRPRHRLREQGRTTTQRWLRFAYDCARVASRRFRDPRTHLDAVPVSRFGDDVEQIISSGECEASFTTRSSGLLNYFLAYPWNTFTGWLLRSGSELVGFALLNVVPSPTAMEGRLVECFLRCADAALWRGAVRVLVRELERQQVDYVTSLASTPWMEDALQANGFAGRHSRKLRIRDPRRALPAGITFHAGYLEADLGYL